jgi:hypothetical protein
MYGSDYSLWSCHDQLAAAWHCIQCTESVMSLYSLWTHWLCFLPRPQQELCCMGAVTDTSPCYRLGQLCSAEYISFSFLFSF